MYEIVLPIEVQVSPKKKFILNLNNYRNAHYHILNKSKVVFAEIVADILSKQSIPKLPLIEIEYILYVGDKRRKDVSNVCSIVDKYFCDTLTELGIIPDDDYEHLPKVTYKFGGYDKGNPRVVAVIKEIKE